MKFLLRSLLFIISLYFSAATLQAQRYVLSDFNKVDSLAYDAQPKLALALIEKINNHARVENNAPLLIKSVVYRMLFQSYLEEDSFSKILKDLKGDIELAKQPTKSILQSLLAETYWKYYQENSYRFNNRTTVQNDVSEDIRTWSNQKLIDNIKSTYLGSLKETNLLQSTKMDLYDKVLTGPKSNRRFRATLYEALAHRALDAFVNTQLNLNIAENDDLNLTSAIWMAKQSNFVTIPLNEADSSTRNITLQLFQSLLKFNAQQKNIDAMADADLRRIKFIYQSNRNTDKIEEYKSALQAMADDYIQSEVYADILVEHAQLNNMNSIFLNNTSHLNLIESFNLASKAIKAYPESIGGNNAAKLITKLKKAAIEVRMNTKINPKQPAQIHFSYRNTDTIYLKLYNQNLEDATQFNNAEDFDLFIQKRKAYKEWFVALPAAKDYQMHTLVDKIDGLPIGSYLLIVQNRKDDSKHTTYTYINFTSSNLTVIDRLLPNKEHQYFVTNSINGGPLKDVKIQQKRHQNAKGEAPMPIYTDQLGFATTKDLENINKAIFSYEKDSMLINVNNYASYNNEMPIQVVLFTDRAIYRPGQTLYYKGLIIKTDKDQKHSLPDHSIDLTFNDVNNKEIEKITVKSNDFGTFQGSFSIPVGKMNGVMVLRTKYGTAIVRVEEYKRPTFEINFDKTTATYQLTDSISITGAAVSFAGYAISNSTVKYTVLQHVSPGQPYLRYQAPKQIAFGKTTTGKNGEFLIKFLPQAKDLKVKYRFEIKADITDAAGETVSNPKSINVGVNDINLNIDLPEQLFLKANPDSLLASVTNLNYEPIKANLKLEWLLLESPKRLTHQPLFTAEKYALTKKEFIKNFPNDDFAGESEVKNWPVNKTQLVQNSEIDGKGKLEFSANDLPDGYYKVKISATTLSNDTTSQTRIVRIYGSELSTIKTSKEWLVAEKNSITSNENAIFRIASILPKSKAYYEVYYKDSIINKAWLDLTSTQKRIEIKPQPNSKDFAVQFTLVQNGTVYQKLERINIIENSPDLEIKFLSFRDKLQPGEKETWKLQIRTNKGEKQAAEMVATLYDASLDKLMKMYWNTSFNTYFNYNKFDWRSRVSQVQTSSQLWFRSNYFDSYSITNREYENFNLFGYNYYGGYNNSYHSYLRALENIKRLAQRLTYLQKGQKVYGLVKDGENGLSIPGVIITNGKLKARTDYLGVYEIKGVPGDTLTFIYLGYKTKSMVVGKELRNDIIFESDQSSLNEVMVTGAGEGVSYKKSLTGSVSNISAKQITLRGTNSVTVEDHIIEDHKVYNFASMEMYPMPQIVPRVNFSETAFFYPQLRTDANGEINIEFTIPQSLTRYKMMGFAHTKDLKTATISRELITQKQLAISLNAPRFLREGDNISFSAKINNLAGKVLKGKAMLELRNGITGNVIDIIVKNENTTQHFELENNGNTALKWNLIIPKGINAITYKVLAQAENYSDGEEMTIPVLPNEALITESMPLMVRGKSDKTFAMTKLLGSGTSKTLRNQALTFEFTSNPIWYAIQALPYLVENGSECTEQIFSKFYANSFANSIMNGAPKIKAIFKRWQDEENGNALLSNLEKNQELKSILLEETPWVRNAEDETSRKKRLAIVFDLNRMSYELKANLEKLKELQNTNGSFSWFKGMNDDRYITQHIVLGMVQLKKLNLIDEKVHPIFGEILTKAITYLDDKLVQYSENQKASSYDVQHYLYARSYLQTKSANPKFNAVFARHVDQIKKDWKTMDPYQLAQAALILSRVGNRTEALKIIGLLRQTAQRSEEMGMYWANNRNGWFWYQNQIETQAVLIEAFNEVSADVNAIEEMKIWLLKNKQTNNWKSTKETTAACYALLMNGYDLLSESAEPVILIGNKNLTVQGKEAGTGYQKISYTATAIQPEMGKVQVKNPNRSIAWGAMYWQYFEQLDKVKSSATGVKIKKQLFLQNQNKTGNVLSPINTTNGLSIGDLVKVRIEIYADRNMEYIHLKDLRAAGFEPINVISSLKYQDGLVYYQSTKDASTNFFINYLLKGVYVFEYELRATQAGNFSNGITTLQSMYAPEFTTTSEGIRVNVK